MSVRPPPIAPPIPRSFDRIISAIVQRARSVDVVAFAKLPPDERERVAEAIVCEAMVTARTTSLLHDLAAAVGGYADLAQLVGTTTRTLRRWSDGSLDPSPSARALLNTTARNYGVPIPFPDEARSS